MWPTTQPVFAFSLGLVWKCKCESRDQGLLVSAEDLVAWGRFTLGVMEVVSLWLWLLWSCQAFWMWRDGAAVPCDCLCESCWIVLTAGESKKTGYWKKYYQRLSKNWIACPAQHSSARKQRHLGGTFLTWSACNSTPGNCLSFLTHDACLWPQCSGRGQKGWIPGCRNNQLLNEVTYCVCWSSCVLPPELKETRNWFWYEVHFTLVQDGSIRRQDLVSGAVMFLKRNLWVNSQCSPCTLQILLFFKISTHYNNDVSVLIP